MEQAQTFEGMAVDTVDSFLRALQEFEKQNDRLANGEESAAILMVMLRDTYEAIFTGALKMGVEVGTGISTVGLEEPLAMGR